MEKSINIDEWNRQRRMGIGGSDIGAIVGVNPWRTALDVFLDKTGQAPEKEPSESMRLGTALEPFIVGRYEEETGFHCVEQIGMFHDGCVLANIDRIVDMGDGKTQCDGRVVSKRILEAKTSRHEWVDGVPNTYECQVQWYMGPFPSVEQTDVAVYYTGGNKDPFHIFPVLRDNEVYAYLKAKGEEFWKKYVLTGTMPPPQNEDDCRVIWARQKDMKISVADEKILATIKQLKELREKMEADEAMESELISTIMAGMGDAEILKTEDSPSGIVLATWKAPKDSVKVDWKSIAGQLHPSEELIGRFTKVVPNSRRFNIK